MDCSLGDDVGVETIAKVYRVDIVTESTSITLATRDFSRVVS